MHKLYDILFKDSLQNEIYSLSVIIRTVGIFTKAIVKIMGQDQLHLFFRKLIELSETRVLKVIDKTSSEFQFADDQLTQSQSFKAVLYRQK